MRSADERVRRVPINHALLMNAIACGKFLNASATIDCLAVLLFAEATPHSFG
jgi:hypothetical protein